MARDAVLPTSAHLETEDGPVLHDAAVANLHVLHPIADLSPHSDDQRPAFYGLLAAALTLGIFLTYYGVKFGLNHPPSATGDEPEYDSLGWELAHGDGFQVDYSNAAFRQPYEIADDESNLYRLTTSTRIGTIASRPPLFPLVISLTDRLFGRQFWAVRVVNAGCMALVCGLLVTFACRLGGPRIACVSFLLFVVVDTRTRLYGRAILTEALAAAEVAILCCLLFRFAERPTLKSAALMGLVWAAALLTRTQFILWLPGLLLTISWLAVRRGDAAVAGDADNTEPVRLRRWRFALTAPATMLAVTLLLAAPWMVRNTRVLGEFMPLGSQGWVQLSAAFGDAAWEHAGTWTNLESQGFFEGVTTDEMSLLEEEVAMAHFSRQRALDWIAANPGKALLLAPIKIAQEFRPRTIPEGVILLLSIAGAILAWRDLRTRILLAVAAACCLSIAATWSVEGRFIVPLLFVQHSLIARGLIRLAGDRVQTPADGPAVTPNER